MQKSSYDITIFLLATSVIFVTLTVFIISIIQIYRKRQIHYQQSLVQIKLENEKMLLSAKVEMQEETFKHVSKEIHDNISLSLTLAKLILNSLDLKSEPEEKAQVTKSIQLITRCIYELSDISKSLNADVIIHHGLLRALEEEINKINSACLFELSFRVLGSPMFFDSQKELITFRIIQEAFNNIIKHSKAKTVGLTLNYHPKSLEVTINDDGCGFDIEMVSVGRKAGLLNIKNRVQTLNGDLKIISVPNQGTLINFVIPLT